MGVLQRHPLVGLVTRRHRRPRFTTQRWGLRPGSRGRRGQGRWCCSWSRLAAAAVAAASWCERSPQPDLGPRPGRSWPAPPVGPGDEGRRRGAEEQEIRNGGGQRAWGDGAVVKRREQSRWRVKGSRRTFEKVKVDLPSKTTGGFTNKKAQDLYGSLALKLYLPNLRVNLADG